MLGLSVYIYTNEVFKGCSNNGISAKATKVLWVGEGAPEILDCDDLPRIKLIKGYVKGSVIAVPYDAKPRQYMDGGAFVYTSDSRFLEQVRKLSGQDWFGAVPLHDRQE